jgi:hypothetical protein
MKPADTIATSEKKKKLFYKCDPDCYFTLHDFKGRCLLTNVPADYEQIIDLSELPAGEYVITISGKNGIQIHKLII